MRQHDGHCRLAVQEERQWRLDQPQRQKRRVDRAFLAQHDLPGEDTQKVAGPERQSQDDQPQRLVPIVWKATK